MPRRSPVVRSVLRPELAPERVKTWSPSVSRILAAQLVYPASRSFSQPISSSGAVPVFALLSSQGSVVTFFADSLPCAHCGRRASHSRDNCSDVVGRGHHRHCVQIHIHRIRHAVGFRLGLLILGAPAPERHGLVVHPVVIGRADPLATSCWYCTHSAALRQGLPSLSKCMLNSNSDVETPNFLFVSLL